MDDAPAGDVEQMLRDIVGVEIELTSLQGKWNRSAAGREAVAAGLHSPRTDAARDMAARMRNAR